MKAMLQGWGGAGQGEVAGSCLGVMYPLSSSLPVSILSDLRQPSPHPAEALQWAGDKSERSPGQLHTHCSVIPEQFAHIGYYCLPSQGREFCARNYLWALEITFWTLLPVQPKRQLVATMTQSL